MSCGEDEHVGLNLIAVSVLSVCISACEIEANSDHLLDDDEHVTGQWQSMLTVDQVRQRAGCTTSVVNALSEQLIQEINCLRPNTLVDFSGPNMNLGPAVFPYLQGNGPEDLQAAIRERGRELSVTSALRTLPQQYLLYSWWQAGQCGIRLASRPRTAGTSGLSIDIRDYSGWRPFLANHNFDWLGDQDPVHFDYSGNGTVDLRGLSIRSFQRLWNRNNAADQIVEDGIYGPQTEGRMRQSPSEGLPSGGAGRTTNEFGHGRTTTSA